MECGRRKNEFLLGQAWPVNNGADGRKKNWATAMAGAYVIQAFGSPGRVWDIWGRRTPI